MLLVPQIPEAPLVCSSPRGARDQLVFQASSLPDVLISLKHKNASAHLSGSSWNFRGERDLQTCQKSPARSAGPLQPVPASPAPDAHSSPKNFVIPLPQEAFDVPCTGMASEGRQGDRSWLP